MPTNTKPLRRPTPPPDAAQPYLVALKEAAARRDKHLKEYEAALAAVKELMAGASEAGATMTDVARVAGMSRQRAYEVLDAAKGKP